MKGIKLSIMLVLFCVLFQADLFPIIFSRVQGVVLDNETNQPIGNVVVSIWVFKNSDSFLSRKVTSDANGKFVINDIPSGEYFIMCEKGEYQVFSPYYYLFENNSKTALKVFYLEEGKVKHFVIKMERGGKLKVNVLKKDESGISGFEGVNVSLASERFKFGISGHKTNINGIFVAEGLEPRSDYILYIKPVNFNRGLPFYKETIEIKKNEEVEISKTYDFTDKTGVVGKITLAEGSFDEVDVYLINLNNKSEYIYLLVDGNGDYSFLNVQPGEYKLVIKVNNNQNKSFKKEVIIKIESKIQKVCNINL